MPPPPPPVSALPEPPQPLLGALSNAQWQALLDDLDARIGHFEALPDAALRSQVFELLDRVDALHREALGRLVRLFKDGVLEKVVTDPAIHTLMELYDLLPPDSATAPATPGSAPAAGRRGGLPTIPIRALPAPPPPLPRYPHWVPLPGSAGSPASDALHDDVVVDGVPLLLAWRGGAGYALDAACPVDGAPLQGARFSGYTLSCPRHAGCHYDVRSGQRLGGGPALGCRPLRRDEQGRWLVGFDMAFTPALPSC